MQPDLHSILWEDLSEAQSRLDKALDVLQSLYRAIEEGKVDQPTHQDSTRLNRLMVLADLLYAEIRPWADELLPNRPTNNNLHQAAH
ncbi:MAG: hypothetical protein HY866_06600 [Chloroflexi bacterium]|nr:hypothetical protein [Chloroflexota bacterium]